MTSTAPDARRSSVETFAAVAGLVAFTGVALNAAHVQAAEVGAPANDALLTVLKAIAACYAAWGAMFVLRSRRWGFGGWLLLAIHGAALASVVWSDAPRLTLFRGLQVAGTTLFALTIAVRFDSSERVHLLAVACATVIALSLASLVVIPDTAIMTGEFDGAWRGMFGHKNQLGKFAALSVGVFACLDRRTPSTRWFRPIGLGAAVLCVFGSTSKTALITMLCVFFAFPTIRYLRRQQSLLPHAIGLGSILALGFGILWSHAAEIAEMLGRDMTLSGRTALWFAVIAFIVQRPLLGYGYAAFWRGMEGDSAYISMALHWDVPHAHNGWLDVALDLGLVGVVLTAVFFALCVRRAFQFGVEREGGSEMWPIIGVTIAFIANLTESSLLRANNLTWVILVLASVQSLRTRLPDDTHVREDLPAVELADV